jgi:hypothetical protein
MQLALWIAFQNGTGAPAFPPTSKTARHLWRNIKGRGNGWKMAADVSNPEGLIYHAGKLGVRLHRPYMPREPWHVEAVRPFRVPTRWPK